MPHTRYTVLGIMSGSSLDGIDLAVCTFSLDPTKEDPVGDWSIEAARTVAYSETWRARLRSAVELSARDLQALDADLGHWIGEQVVAFLRQVSLPAPLLIGCHGHTVFHEPSEGYSLQIGAGAAISAVTGLSVVTDLRSADIAAGGEGAPLAPVADRHLFPHYRAFLNLGGIANFSIRRHEGAFLAGDLSGCCQIMDRLAALKGRAYDEGGDLARSGSFVPDLHRAIRSLPFHGRPCPKSLSNQWVTDTLWPVLRDHPASVEDRLHTFVRFLAETIIAELEVYIPDDDTLRVLVTGGGAHNTYLLEQLSSRGDLSFETENEVADFKEAALIALCALLRWRGLPNSLASATGADRDTINGALYAG